MRRAVSQGRRFLLLEAEIAPQQFLHRVSLPRYTLCAVAPGVGENMVQLVRYYAAQRTSEQELAPFRRLEPEIPFEEAPDRGAIDLRERKDDAVADVRQSQRAGSDAIRRQAPRLQLPLKVTTAMNSAGACATMLKAFFDESWNRGE